LRCTVASPSQPRTTVAHEHLVDVGKTVAEPRVMLTLLIVLLLLALLGGGLGYGRFGAVGLSPALLLVVILIILAATGRL
jgi:hypothetical protein